LASFNPHREEKKDLASLAREVKGQMEEKDCNGDSTEKEKGKVRKPGGFRLKREKGKQQTIGNFFQAKSDKSVSPDLDFAPGRLTLGMADSGEGELRVGQDVAAGGPDCVPCPMCSSTFPGEKIERHAATCEGGQQKTEEVGDTVKSEVWNGGSTIHAISDSEEEEEEHVDLESEVNCPSETGSGSAFLDTRRRWQEKMDGGHQSHLESPVDVEEEVPSQSHHEPLQEEVDPFAESDPFLGGESFLEGDTSSISKINESTIQDMGGESINLEKSVVNRDRPKAEEQSNLAKVLDKMKKSMEAEEAERKKLKEKSRIENQKVLVLGGISQRERVSSHRDQHRPSENSLNSSLKQNKRTHERAGVKVKSSKSRDLQLQMDKREKTGSKGRAEDAEVTESRQRLEAKLNMKRREANGQTRLNGHQLENRKSHSRLNTSSKSGIGHVKSQQDKNKVADEFVACLTPFLKNGRIVNKETFKVLARDLTHKAVETGLEMTRTRVKATITNFFHTNTTPVSVEIVKELVTAFNI